MNLLNNLKPAVHCAQAFPLPRAQLEADGCFTAGTLVHTESGLVPIEQVKVGDKVLSQEEMKGVRACKAVAKTFVHHEKAVRHIKYCPESGDKTLYLFATDSHLFWVEGTGWTRADRLEEGDHVEFVDGARGIILESLPVYRTDRSHIGWYADYESADTGTEYDFEHNAWVASRVLGDLKIQESRDPYLKVTVYNFEVEDFHTYYVGPGGVWVHCRTLGP